MWLNMIIGLLMLTSSSKFIFNQVFAKLHSNKWLTSTNWVNSPIRTLKCLSLAFKGMKKISKIRVHVLCSITVQHLTIKVIKFVSDIRLVGGFFRVLWFHPTDGHDITEILLKIVLNTYNPNPPLINTILLIWHSKNGQHIYHIK
jgi:hypothetical protein